MVLINRLSLGGYILDHKSSLDFLRKFPNLGDFLKKKNHYVDFHKKIAYANLQKHVFRSFLENGAQTFSKMYILQKHSDMLPNK